MRPQHAPLVGHIMLFGIATVIADQATKLAATFIASGHRSGAVIPVRNHEFSLGIAHASLPVMIALMAVGVTALGSYLVRATLHGQVPAWATGLLIGGAVSNLADRAAGGSVRDFLATPWVVLNLADLAVIVGLAGWLTAHHHSAADGALLRGPRR
jgi:Lipoprotein signal peptidase